jgi:hypothetical protein
MENKNIIKPDFLSFTTQQLSIGLTETDCIFSTASGFLYSHKSRVYLITNWHNVTNRNPLTGEPISDKNGGIPDIFLTYLRLKDVNKGSEIQKIFLYEDAELAKPKWLIHPKYKENIDVVAIELEKLEKYRYFVINEVQFDDDIEPEIGDDCFVLGYPFSEMRYLGLPIWKRASIASEPSVNEDQLPKILIDTATRPGLSGSPVIYRRTGIHKMGENGQFNNDSIIGRIQGFLGIYSGRIGKGEIHAQLGIVWKRKVIDEIIEGNLKGDIDFQIGNKKNGL